MTVGRSVAVWEGKVIPLLPANWNNNTNYSQVQMALSEEFRRERARKGGLASGAKRRERANEITR